MLGKKSKNNKKDQTIEAYNKGVRFYSEKFDSYGVKVDDINRALKLNQSSSKKILELGCGNGRDAKYIISKVGVENYIGVDASKGLIEIARQKNPFGMFHVKDILNFLKEKSEVSHDFGVIFAFYSMLHMERGEFAEILKKCKNLLKIGGILYISSKYGDYKEIEIENLGSKKYYYSYEPEDIEEFCDKKMETIYKIIHDSDYGPSFTIALRKIQ